MKFEDASKIAMYRTTDILFTFVFQHIFLRIDSNLLSILGAVCIAIGMLIVIGFKLLDKNENTKLKKLKLSAEHELKVAVEVGDKAKLDVDFTSNYGCFKKILFFKF